MRDYQNFISGKSGYLYAGVLLLFVFVICAAFSRAEGDEFDTARREVLLRKIGHELLLQSGDSTSRVLPVKKVAENEYRISFEKNLTFQPDSLVNMTRRLLAHDPLAGDYVVSVLNYGKDVITFGYAISGDKKNDILACSGRRQPMARYVIDIKFKPSSNVAKNGYLLGSLPFLAFVGFVFFRSVKPRRTLPKDQSAHTFTFGSVLFDAQQRRLTVNGDAIDLTGTETRLLLIFASAPNETIARSRLQKEIWEDEGVIVGRSLDMFISKLRKKLEPALEVNIVVIRSKGYKLEISA